MIKRLHAIAGLLALITIAAFWLSTVTVELFGGPTAILAVKTGILWGLLVLVPAMLAVGMSGMRLGGRSRHPRVVAKRRRMPVIAGNGLLILVPAAFILQHLAASGAVGPLFYAVQAIELMAGAVNVVLLTLSFRDGLGLRRRRTG